MKYTYSKQTKKFGKLSIYPEEKEGTIETTVNVGRRKVAVVWKFANDGASEKYVIWLLKKYAPKNEEVYLASVVKVEDAGKVLDAYFSKIKALAKDVAKMK